MIPEELAVQKLFLHQAEIDSVTVSDQEVLQEVDRRLSWLEEQIGSKEKMEEYYNKTIEDLYNFTDTEKVRYGIAEEMIKRIQSP